MKVSSFVTALAAVVAPVLVQSVALAQPIVAAGYSEVTYNVENGMTQYRSTIVISPSGDVKVTPPRGGAPFTTRLTVGELANLNASWSAAKVETLPANVGDHIIPDGSYFTITSKIGNKTYKSGGFQVGARWARAQSLLTTLGGIEQRVLKLTPTVEQDVTGLVMESAGKVMIEVNRSNILEVTNAPWKAVLKAAKGNYVTARGTVKKTNMFGGTIEVKWVDGIALRKAALFQSPGVFAPQGWLAAGKSVKIVGEVTFGSHPIPGAAAGEWFKIRLANGKEWWTPASYLQVGGKFHPLAPTGGVIGGVPNHP